ncbi:MAG: hypothetical protein ACMV16_01390 [Macromonas sp.]
MNQDHDKARNEFFASQMVRSGTSAFVAAQYNAVDARVSATDLMQAMDGMASEVQAGSTDSLEQALVNQFATLAVMFEALAGRAKAQTDLKAMDTLLRLSLKCQAQARQTAESIGNLKNPATFIKNQQVNMASGPQQVNNGVNSGLRKSESAPNELLNATHENQQPQCLDAPEEARTVGAHPRREAVGAVNRA